MKACGTTAKGGRGTQTKTSARSEYAGSLKSLRC